MNLVIGLRPMLMADPEPSLPSNLNSRSSSSLTCLRSLIAGWDTEYSVASEQVGRYLSFIVGSPSRIQLLRTSLSLTAALAFLIASPNAIPRLRNNCRYNSLFISA